MAVQKILQLGSREFLAGISPLTYDVSGGAQGTWVEASGITPYKEPNRVSKSGGILQAGPAPTNITGAVVVDSPRGSVTDISSSTENLYIIGNDGHFYKIDLDVDETVTDLRAATQIPNSTGTSGPTGGMEIFQPRGGSKTLYYWYRDSAAADCRIGSWDLSGTYPTGWNDTLVTGLQDSTTNPTHRMFDEIYYGNLDRLGQIKDDGAAGITHTANVLDFPSDYQVTTISDDGVYLVVGITKNSGNSAGRNLYYADTKIVFWDKNSSSWQREWSLPAPNITSIQKVGNRMMCFGGRKLFEFTFSSPPRQVLPDLTSNESGKSEIPSFAVPTHRQVAVVNDQLIWCSSDDILTYGSVVPGFPPAYHKPITTGAGEDIVFIEPNAKVDSIYFGTTTDKLYHVDMSDTSSTSVSCETVLYDLGHQFKLSRIDIVFEDDLASGDSLNIDVIKNDNISADDWGTASFATYGAVNRVSLHKPSTMNNTDNQFDMLKLKLNFNGGVVKVKRLDVYGERIQN